MTRNAVLAALVPFFLLLAGCGATYSEAHFTDHGTAVPPPKRFTPEPAVQLPDDFGGPMRPVPTGLPALTAAYRALLVEEAHPFPEKVRQDYADAQIAALQRQYAGRDEALAAELARRLNPPPARPAPPGRIPARFFPPDPETPSSGERRTP